MRRENRMARLLRAVSGRTQDQLAAEVGVHPSLVAQIEQGLIAPRPELLARMAGTAALSLEEAGEALRLLESFQQDRQRRDRNEDLDPLEEELRLHLSRIRRRLRTLPAPESPPPSKDSDRAANLFQRLMELDTETALAVIQVAEEFQNREVCERIREESLQMEPQDPKQAAELARLARGIAERVGVLSGW